ncbi:Hypothetical protein PHPALM_6742 [Phytophthora palmivora]|uniref:Uncharacterized protein n=1 Tax=Phytophthora palmivora TaxID=4796 RepID=A0A2P4YE41_9STRA|nr:Hypothetical protein PHPALM_6742 [Phytophthora palmivora]
MPAPACEERRFFFRSHIPIPQPDGTTSENITGGYASAVAPFTSTTQKLVPQHWYETMQVPIERTSNAVRTTKLPTQALIRFLSVEEQRRFEREILEFQSGCALPDCFVERASAKRRFARMPHFELPSRKELGGRILKTNAEQAENDYNGNLREKQGELGYG